MDFYILDDDIAVVKTLKHIITERKIGTVIGYNTDVECAIEDIKEENPSIIMVDFMMKEMDGITFIKEVKKFNREAAFIMISKLSDKSLVNQAYDAGVEFFVSKPINVLEIERVCQNIIERIRLKKVVDNIQNAFMEVNNSSDGVQAKRELTAERKQNWLDVLLGSLGILGEKGTNDIRKIYACMENSNSAYSKHILGDVARSLGDSEKNVEQRVRRALKKALSNVAAARLIWFRTIFRYMQNMYLTIFPSKWRSTFKKDFRQQEDELVSRSSWMGLMYIGTLLRNKICE